MIRISFSLKSKPDNIYSGSWYDNSEREMLEEWISVLSKLYPEIQHWIEEGE